MNFIEASLNGYRTLIDTESTPTLIRRGVLSLKTDKGLQAIYIIEHAEEKESDDIVSVYAVKKDSNPPVKDFEAKEVYYKYRESTLLGKLANQVFSKKLSKPEEKVEEKPPLFLAPITEGTDTITEVEGPGFYEREPDKFRIKEGKPFVEYGENTGVFIGLNSIKWEKAFVQTRGLLEDYIRDKEIWFDMNLESSNPLNNGKSYIGSDL